MRPRHGLRRRPYRFAGSHRAGHDSLLAEIIFVSVGCAIIVLVSLYLVGRL